MKIYIIGSVASGKTTLGKELSKLLNIRCEHLDGVVHIKDPSNKKWGNTRRNDKDIKMSFDHILSRDEWLIEDAGRPIFNDGLLKADHIIYLKPSRAVRKRRIITRYIKQKLGLEFSLYRPSMKMVKFMFKCLNDYESGIDNLENRLEVYSSKVIIIKNKSDKIKLIQMLRIQLDSY